jgi:hypothetical protein
MKKSITILLSLMGLLSISAIASEDNGHTSDTANNQGSVSTANGIKDGLSLQREALTRNTRNKGFGPQSPRDIDASAGNNYRTFSHAPQYQKMNLCNIHFHKNAEHKGGQFTTFVGYGDGHGYNSGYKYNGTLSSAESTPLDAAVCLNKHGGLLVGDTIEVHYVHSSARVKPGHTLGACLSDDIKNPQLRVETQVYVLVNDSSALDFFELSRNGVRKGLHQALNIPNNTGTPIQYSGSTTGPSYNEKGSPFQVTWNVRPQVSKVDITSVGEWCKGNVYKEDHAHGVRNLVINPDLLSTIK